MKAELGSKTSPAPQKYTVISKDGLFKNGKLYKKGTVVTAGKEITQASVAPFLEAGDIKEAK